VVARTLKVMGMVLGEAQVEVVVEDVAVGRGVVVDACDGN
jgi:hypothetical protein